MLKHRSKLLAGGHGHSLGNHHRNGHYRRRRQPHTPSSGVRNRALPDHEHIGDREDLKHHRLWRVHREWPWPAPTAAAPRARSPSPNETFVITHSGTHRVHYRADGKHTYLGYAFSPIPNPRPGSRVTRDGPSRDPHTSLT